MTKENIKEKQLSVVSRRSILHSSATREGAVDAYRVHLFSFQGANAVTATLIILGIVVVTALAFDFTNGFHDTANAMATSIATGA